MNKNIKLAILGGDARQRYLARELADRGFETAVWGIGGDARIGEAVKCRDPKSALSSASAVILPLPVTLDGATLNSENEEKLKLNAILDYSDALIFGGKFNESFLHAAEVRKRRVIDYFESETLQIRNAVPTAEGAVSIAMQHLDKTVMGCRAAVVGYGRIGQMLAGLLLRMGAEVTVAARNLLQLAVAKNFGAKILRLDPALPSGGLLPLCESGAFDVVFNTVPARLFDAEVLSFMPADILLIDLSSVPGGVDFGVAKERGIRAVWALSLPGKYAPESAGSIICDTLMEYFEREGIT
ncbi:MAG: dipicolinate synthase [Clostridia bacterium]|nr:dipicolinate synthase [Clostridia bacterium]